MLVRNFVINGMEAAVEVKAWDKVKDNKGGVFVSQLSLFFDRIDKYRNLILISQARFIVYFDGGDINAITAISKQFQVYKINS